MSLDQADINRCPPGGDAGVAKLATLLKKPIRAIDPDCGLHEPLQVAIIEEEHCIGCTLCIQACPVDAIIGANKKMHTVLSDWCTGCDLCVAPCPVDCIVMMPVQPMTAWTSEQAQVARARFESREQRLQNEADVALKKPKAATADKQAVIAAALARARSRRATP